MKKLIFISIALSLLTVDAVCQKKGQERYFGDPIFTDSLSTLFIPTKYDDVFLTSNKIAAWGGYYANIVAYNYKTDTYKKLFDKETFIESFKYDHNNYEPRPGANIKNMTAKWVFLLVKTTDTNSSGRIDENDPSILFAVSTNGEDLKRLTGETENVVSFEPYEKQGFILIKIQKDSDNNKSFKNDDKDFYFKKVSLTDLAVGKGIEIK